jgi:hypothetical protein
MIHSHPIGDCWWHYRDDSNDDGDRDDKPVHAALCGVD